MPERKVYKLFKTYNHVYTYNVDSIDDYFILINQGGTSSGKTWSVLQLLTKVAIQDYGVVVTVVGQDIPNLKVGALRDFQDLIASSPLLKASLYNPDSLIGPYRFRNGSIIEFKSYDDQQDARSGKRKYLFINEANGVRWDVAEQLILRTTGKVIIDYNPTNEFWAHKMLAPRTDAKLIISTFEDNPYVGERVVEQLLEYRRKWEETGDTYWENKWKVYGMGLTGTVEGVVFPNVEWISRLPRGGVKGMGMDFGFSNDPTAINQNMFRNKKIFSEKLCYEYGMTPGDIDEVLVDLGVSKKMLIVADSAHMSEIETLRRKGWNIVPCIKGPGSVESGISLLKNYDLHIVPDPEGDYENERDNYVWKNIRGQVKNIPEDHDNHLWDALRYWFTFINAPKARQLDAFKKMRVSRRGAGPRRRRRFKPI